MPRPNKLSPATRFSLDKREQVLTDWMAGFNEEDIAKEHSSKNVKLTIDDINEIIKYQKTKSPEEMETIRKYRQKQFIDKAWGIIKLAQIEIIYGLRKHKIPPGIAMNIISQMVDKLRTTELRVGDERMRDSKDLPKIDKDEINNARERIKQLNAKDFKTDEKRTTNNKTDP